MCLCVLCRLYLYRVCVCVCCVDCATLVPRVANMANNHRAVQIEAADWPWIVSLHGGPRQNYFCAGVIVNEEWVLTAAHCINQ